MTEKLPAYGGQAVVEGVMMRGQKAVAIAMRAPDDSIEIHREELRGIYRSRITRIPFLRGLVVLWDALGLGIRALIISVNVQLEEEGEEMGGAPLYLTLALSLGFAVVLFILTPAGVGYLFDTIFDFGSNAGLLAEGISRLAILVGYIWAIGFMPDVKRVFGYHGAEHKTINAFEAGAKLSPEIVRFFPLEHPRCGTAFLLTVVVASILLFSLLPDMGFGYRLLSRLLLLPVIASLAYEYIRWTAGHMHWRVVRWIVIPNLALQRLTTREPSLRMLEVAIAAFMAMRTAESEESAIEV
ncbi:MAG TPA: DUF1385 domain-containing protein [Anaerolineales bacterium]|nr:DUF1385 domain-containing protein [Anaerolineales bacterium]